MSLCLYDVAYGRIVTCDGSKYLRGSEQATHLHVAVVQKVVKQNTKKITYEYYSA